ncbi:MAG: hypothetical protein GY938_30760 [Ketobacter sp.]|nr:hypothetical protein [Ketobacter sp.]
MNEQRHTPGPWVNGYGNGLTGPTTPTGHPTCGEAVKFHYYCEHHESGAEYPKSQHAEYPKSQHTVVSKGIETVAIIPLNGMGGKAGGEANAEFIVRACNAHADLLKALEDLQEAVREHHLLDVKKRFSLCSADAQAITAIAKANEPDQGDQT